MLESGMSTEHVTRHVGCSSRAIRNLRIRFRTTGNNNDLPRRGRPRVTTRGQYCYIMNTHLCNRFQTATATAANTPGLHNNRICAQTVRNRLRENDLYARRPYVGCILTQRHRQHRLNWARIHNRCIRRRWNTVLFSDESRFSLRGDAGDVLERDRFGAGRYEV